MPRIVISFSIVFLLLAGVIVLGRIIYNNTLRFARLTERSRNVIKLYEDIDVNLRSAEIFLPSFGNAANDTLRKIYSADTDTIEADIKILRGLLAVNPEQSAMLDTLEGLIKKQLTAGLSRNAPSIVDAGELQRLGDLSAAHRLIRRGLVLEEDLLSKDKTRLDRANGLNNLLTLVLAGLALTVIVATFFSQFYLRKKTDRLEGFLESVLNTSQNGILHCRAVRRKGELIDLTIAFANKASNSLLSADPQTVIGKRWSEVEAFKQSSLLQACADVISKGQAKELGYLNVVNGQPRSFTLSLTKLNDGVTLSFYEDTIIKQTAADLQENIAALQQTNSELEEYAYAASHDLQEPLRKIRTFGAFLKETQGHRLDEKGAHQLDKILTSTERMTMLIKDLLSYSGLRAKEVQLESTDLNEILDAVLDDLEVMIAQSGAIITRERLPHIEAIPVQINQLFYNLVNNSLKFAKPDFPLHVDVSCKRVMGKEVIDVAGLKPTVDYYEIIFSDNGIGFSQQYARQIFELFKRLHDKAKYAGSGIGLSLCKKVVTNHGGVIEANGKEGVGAQFYIYLPAGAPTTPFEVANV